MILSEFKETKRLFRCFHLVKRLWLKLLLIYYEKKKLTKPGLVSKTFKGSLLH